MAGTVSSFLRVRPSECSEKVLEVVDRYFKNPAIKTKERAKAGVKSVVKPVGSGTIKTNLQLFASSGKESAEKYCKYWSEYSLKDAVSKFIGEDAVKTETKNGKIIFSNSNSSFDVVYDKTGKYFRIEDIAKKDKRRYTDMYANDVSNITVNGKTRGRTKEEYESATHFNNIEEVQN